MPTLSEVRALLSRYSGQGNDFLSRLNLVRARLLQQGNWPGSVHQITLPIYTDKDGNNIVTLPRQYIALLAGAVQSGNAVNCPGQPLEVQNPYSEFSANGLGFNANARSFQEVAGYFAVFQEWTTPSKIRIKPATSETGTLVLSGFLADTPAMESLAFSGAAAITSTVKFDANLFRLAKPATSGRLSAYAVDDAGTETLVATYETDETLPRWKRYKVPGCKPPLTTYRYVALAKLAYVAVANDTDEVVPGNIGALRHGLDALLNEDSREFDEADKLWERARALLSEQAENEAGPSAQDMVEIEDSFDMAGITSVP